VEAEALTEHAATFTRRDLLQAVAERLPDGAPVTEVERLADAVVERGRDELVGLGPRRGRLTSVDSIRRGDGRLVAGDEDEPRMTTRRLLATEQHAIRTAVARRRDGLAIVDGHVLERVLAARPTMTGEQADMVRRLTTGGEGVTVVVGRAGTGKTFSLDAARDAWQTAGIDVTGVTLAARAARELEDTAGIASTTIHRLLLAIERGPGSPLRPGSVLVVDEAGMVGTRQLARLLHHAERQQVKVVLVGDPRQLPEIHAGGLFGDLARRLDPIELVHNRRQSEPWEIGALDQLRHGDPADALAAYHQHGRVVTADTAEALREQLVSDWWHAHHQVGATDAVMIALRQTDVDDLNRRARTRLAAADLLTGETLTVDGVGFQVGDRILCLKNDRRVGVVNGTFATITRIDGRDLDVTDDHGSALRLPVGYVDAGHVTHGYAITGHKAQGLTVDHAFVYGSDQLYREWGYVALSRGRHANTLYVHAAATDPTASPTAAIPGPTRTPKPSPGCAAPPPTPPRSPTSTPTKAASSPSPAGSSPASSPAPSTAATSSPVSNETSPAASDVPRPPSANSRSAATVSPDSDGSAAPPVRRPPT
jgi:ATP-dependent exoDNAse (exonuclease V) alpha subunit